MGRGWGGKDPSVASPHPSTAYFATLSQFSSRSLAFGKGKETAARQANSWRKGEQLVDFGSHKPDVWVNGRPLSQDLTLTVKIFNHLKTARVYYPSQTKH